MQESKLAWQANRLLSTLSEGTRNRLLARSVVQSLQLKTVLYAEYEAPPLAYFPLSGVASVVALTTEGRSAEVGFIGCEGVTGAYHLLGPAEVPTRCFVQIEGSFQRIPFADLRAVYDGSSEFRARLHEFLQADSLIVSQMAGCNQMHELGPRLARWLLMADERHKADTLGVTHEILAEMVAAQRATVTTVMGKFKRQGLTSSNRGQVTITDKTGLRDVACDCYGTASNLFKNLYKQ
jgi:CRP-like cAMP-binding protein